MCRPVLPKQVI
uniref:Uncharacterized protein n=1 Tax=Anopheles minimus TaxID=112268 RepID=A0A182WN66_9DIPT